VNILRFAAPNRRFPTRFTTRLTAAVLLLIILVVTLAGLALYLSRSQYAAHAETDTRNLSEVVAHNLAATFDKIDLVLLTTLDEVTRQLRAGGIDDKTATAYLARQLGREPNLSALGIVDAGGNLRYSARIGGDNEARTNIIDREHFIQLREDPDAQLVFSKPLVERISGKWAIILARRINASDGAFAGIVYAAVQLAHIQDRFAGLNIGSLGAIKLRDGDLVTITRYPELEGNKTTTGNTTVSRELREQLKRNPDSGSYFAVGIDEHARVLSYHKVDNHPYYVTVGLFPDDYLVKWQHEAAYTLALVGVFIAVTTLLLLVIRRAWHWRDMDARRVEDLSRRLVAVQESERRQLALDLHDLASPNLAALRLNIEAIQSELPESIADRFGAQLSDIAAILDDTTISLRDICSNLRPAMLDYSGLLPALKDYAAQFSRATPVSVVVKGAEPLQPLSPDVESLLFRIAQEAVTNAIKHAGATSIMIELLHDADRTCLVIVDDGVGFDQAQLGKEGSKPGLGLVTMRERAEFAGGRFSVESAPGRGTRVEIDIAHNKDEAAA
jgi:signal transduction histidine kinase